MHALNHITKRDCLVGSGAGLTADREEVLEVHCQLHAKIKANIALAANQFQYAQTSTHTSLAMHLSSHYHGNNFLETAEMVRWLQDRDGGHYTSYHCHLFTLYNGDQNVSGHSVKAGLWEGLDSRQLYTDSKHPVSVQGCSLATLRGQRSSTYLIGFTKGGQGSMLWVLKQDFEHPQVVQYNLHK